GGMPLGGIGGWLGGGGGEMAAGRGWGEADHAAIVGGAAPRRGIRRAPASARAEERLNAHADHRLAGLVGDGARDHAVTPHADVDVEVAPARRDPNRLPEAAWPCLSVRRVDVAATRGEAHEIAGVQGPEDELSAGGGQD